MKKIGLLMVGLLVFGQAELTRTDVGVVKDSDTKLEWQDNILIKKRWNDAITYCENLELDNKNDWRLPNINELKTIVLETQYAPTIDKIFKFKTSTPYWSSTWRKYPSSLYSYRWTVQFNDGKIIYWESSDNCDVRCVRDAD